MYNRVIKYLLKCVDNTLMLKFITKDEKRTQQKRKKRHFDDLGFDYNNLIETPNVK